MVFLHAPALLLGLSSLLQTGIAAPTAAVTVGQIRAVQSPVFHLYLQSLPKNKTTPVLGPSSTSETFTISSTIQSRNTSQYLNIVPSTTSYKALVFSSTPETTAWGLEGDTIITVTGSSMGRQLNFLACASSSNGYYDIFLQTGSDTPSGRSCSNYQTLHLPCLC
ncbi:hypothetical protein GQ43DRAFT_455823 [Delitschia confertaspora ATCC 74209]|uniref:IPT/TIG domain-containing protein n=1 Tax=Delitschia confertaspora ATCC 74209 TaxID=1513339 RepID=A0A9P4JNA4_9PLEO|nr:hypothetical protein GQ43DRAFT_455823 [Delitschia confertaspora ATCC 74209]